MDLLVARLKAWFKYYVSMVALPARLQDHHGERLNYNQWWTQKQNDNTDGGRAAGLVVQIQRQPFQSFHVVSFLKMA